MCSDKYLVVEGECVHFPLPYKEDQAFITCFQWIQIRSEMSERKPADALFHNLMPNTPHSILAVLRVIYLTAHKADYLRS